MAEVRTRFAPSPTGYLHMGSARTALFNWAYARRHGGQLVLRIEDTDRARSSQESEDALIRGLDWLGIAADEGPFRQSERRDLHDAAIERLLRSGHAYRCRCSVDELAERREATLSAAKSWVYDGRCRNRELGPDCGPHTVRLRLDPEEQLSWNDLVFGHSGQVAAEIGDMNIRRSDGHPLYNLAVVVDDELMGVTHVIRGQEHLYNTPRHVLLQDALRFRRPSYAHISLILNPDGSKMSKRDRDKALRREVGHRRLEGAPPGSDIPPETWGWWIGDDDHQLDLEASKRLAEALGVELPEIDIEEFRRAGYLPEVLVNYMALLGWSPGGGREKFDQQFLEQHFSLDRIIKSPARFDREISLPAVFARFGFCLVHREQLVECLALDQTVCESRARARDAFTEVAKRRARRHGQAHLGFVVQL